MPDADKIERAAAVYVIDAECGDFSFAWTGEATDVTDALHHALSEWEEQSTDDTSVWETCGPTDRACGIASHTEHRIVPILNVREGR